MLLWSYMTDTRSAFVLRIKASENTTTFKGNTREGRGCVCFDVVWEELREREEIFEGEKT